MGRNMPRASKYSRAVTGKVAQYGVSQFIPIELATSEPLLDNLAFVHRAISKERGVDVFAVVKRMVNTDAYHDPFRTYTDAYEAIVTHLYRARYNSRTVRRRAFPERYVSLRRVRIARRRRRRELRRIARGKVVVSIGCCDNCAGTGHDASSPETSGWCWDCYGTGHLHPWDGCNCLPYGRA